MRWDRDEFDRDEAVVIGLIVAFFIILAIDMLF